MTSDVPSRMNRLKLILLPCTTPVILVYFALIHWLSPTTEDANVETGQHFTIVRRHLYELIRLKLEMSFSFVFALRTCDLSLFSPH